MKLQEFEKAESVLWHVVFLMLYTGALVHFSLCWYLQSAPKLVWCLVAVECLGRQVVTYAYRLISNKT